MDSKVKDNAKNISILDNSKKAVVGGGGILWFHN